MSLLRSERFAAAILLLAAVAGIVLANSPVGPALFDLQHAELALPGTPIVLSIGHWVSDGLLAVFFFTAAIELKHELVEGDLNTVGKAIRPAIAALGGVIVPVVVYLFFTIGSGFEQGWPIPTATDIAFALGVLAVVGKGLPSKIRVFLLALAILDDIIAIIIIALFFTSDPQPLLIVIAAVGVVLFAFLSRKLGGRHSRLIALAMLIVGLLVWALVLLSGIHATIAGVALGLSVALKPGSRVRHTLEPAVNGLVLPLFAFSAALVLIPQVAISELAPPFWGILIALPVGKIIGITLGGLLGRRFGPAEGALPLGDLLAAGALGGVGFTVSLLMNELAFGSALEVKDEGTLAVLLGSTISIVLAVILVGLRARHYRRVARDGEITV